MGLFDLFKKKTQQPQSEEAIDFNPLDINSVIGYMLHHWKASIIGAFLLKIILE